MINKPWFQILFFVLAMNFAQGIIYIIGLHYESELALFFGFWFSCVIALALLTQPPSATSGHKLLVLTYLFATFYFAAATIITVWALYGSMLAYNFYESIHSGFYATMQFFTALEIVCIFANASTRMGRLGGYFQRGVDYLYGFVYLRLMRSMGVQRI